jgi:hypothetical protein
VALRANPAVRALVAELAPLVSVRHEAEELVIEVALAEIERAEREGAGTNPALKRVLAAAAEATGGPR